MTVSAFFGVSLEPPLIAVSLDQQAATLRVIRQSGHFAVNVLSAEQAVLSDRFAWIDEAVRFDGVALHENADAQSPLLEGALLHLDCELSAIHPAGDHLLCIGTVSLALWHAGEPLVFYGSRYHRLARI